MLFYNLKNLLRNMHNFDDLIYRGTTFTLNGLEENHSKISEELQTSGATSLVKNLQMIRSQKVILAIGMFSLFESILQNGLSCKDGFAEAKKILTETGNIQLRDRFEMFFLAINILKHGHGRSYDKLIAKSGLPFKIKQSGQDFFNEGDVSEISTLIEVDNEFVLNCAELIENISKESL